MSVTKSKVILTGLARKLVSENLLTEAVAEQAFEEAIKTRSSFVAYLVEKKLLGSKEVAHAASEELGVPLVDIENIDLNPDVIKLIDEKLLKKHRALPLFKRGNRLFVAMSDPTNFPALDEIKFQTKMNTEAILVEEDKILKLMEKVAELFDTGMKLDGELGDLDLADEDAENGVKEEEKSDSEDAPIVKFVNKMLLDAIKLGASDLHFEPYEKFYRVRFRVDGMLRSVSNPPVGLNRKLAARIKVMSRLDVSERRVPQDGRIKLKISASKSMDFRVSTCPTLFGEKIVMRILDSSAAKLNIDQLGYEPEQKEQYLQALSNPYGMVLVTGPTGSGKTVSLYTGVNILNKEDVNISTAEDPVEINLPGVNQVQVDERTGMSFAKALKAFLRQDPDIILVGEIRDLETGGIAIKAASTGHMVMSTLHTNDAPQTLTRMIDMGIAPFAIATSVNLVMAQRLCRRLCSCKVEVDIPKKALLEEGFKEQEVNDPNFKVYGPRPDGCEKCTNSGYKGRVGIYQVMPISDAMRRMIMEGKNAVDLADQAQKEGIPDLRQSGLKKVKDGLTSLEEINRVVLKE
ncbi:type IV-A pilus assembly ATPase PilB [Beggiatoa leptomitoformis]|uniref:Type IV-A pilus assembly ATPase PilB n=1 Tax=Beggiatoa leptomitoformis TaxID=288004 RepID=A0A2N9YGN6_9GAMM|nr:type IV-A pilus assembly ATPase PilB [Beggiatoa leptomitoformis]ALG67986.1 type IV-A pilus assembly ATPase PilB [Beggiatoa leptomitoformis]AUI69731.1 type IV-A pilus assembly ATPase PilB [Beggiatoa leptomitoformis]